MYFQQLFIYVALLAAAMSLQAKVGRRSDQNSDDGGAFGDTSLRNTAKAKECSKTADHDCPGGGRGHQIVFVQCMAVYWKSVAQTHKCPYTEVDCLCYNGCIADQSGSSHVTEFCVDACNLAQQPAPCTR
ncbi:hypothetical protein V8E36_006788 [Tilletia maclaganii]